MKRKRIMIMAGEPSGDLQAAHLVKSLKKINPDLEIFGLGGKKMQAEGVEIIYDITELAVVGFFEVLKHLVTFKKIFESLLILLEIKRPDIVILVDYPGFNLRFAKVVKEKNIPVIYYISPQVWAWGKDRIKQIKKYVDRMIVIFGFEEKPYKQAGVDVDFVGHPFLDIVKPQREKEKTIEQASLRHDSIKIALMPGSRKKEVQRHLPVMLKACEIIKTKIPKAEFIISKRKELNSGIYDKIISRSKISPASLENSPYEIMDIADLVIVSSGSATLEVAVMQKPMVIIYKTSFLTYFLAANMIRIPDIGLVNVVATKRIVPELVQFQVTPKNIAKEALNILSNPKLSHQIKEELKNVRDRLGENGASLRAAQIINKFIGNS